jgi:FHS family glucose/mannose:H+ symporter-like MFS transporter
MRKWFLVWLAYLSLFLYGFVDNARGPVYPDLLRDLSLSDTAGAWFFFTASAAALLNNLVLFKWIERIGPYRTTQVYSLVQAVGLLIVGLSPTYAGTLAGCAVLGTSLGGLGISVNLLVAEGAPPAIRRQALAGLHCMYGVSSLFAPLLVTGLTHLGLDWRRTLGSLLLAPLVVFAASFFGDEKLALHDQPLMISARPNRRAALLFATICTLYVVAEIAIGTRLALYARRDWGYSLEEANRLVSGFFLGLFLGRLAFAVVPFKLSSLKILGWSASLSFLCFALGLALHPGWLALAGLAMSVFYPCLIELVNERHGRNLNGTRDLSAGAPTNDAKYITSWCITLQSFGTLALHFSIGELSDRFGLRLALWVGPSALALAILMLFLISPGKNARPA